jgi:branched-chain amino acid transport system ATP-binding protein
VAALLALRDVSKSYGALRVIRSLSVTLEPGQALGVIGPNGAGKTTMFNLITGDVRPDRGRVELDGREISRMAPFARCRAGIGRSYQIPHPLSGMTVFENLLVGAIFGGCMSERDAAAHCVAVLRLTGLTPKANRLAGSLALLDRKRLELARALATRPRLLLLDEIAGGLTEPEVRALVATINEIRAEGVSIIWIEHIVHALLSVVDRLLVINFGETLAEGEPRAVMANPEVRRVYMGLEV